jgi:hypothetical protein
MLMEAFMTEIGKMTRKTEMVNSNILTGLNITDNGKKI